jgi:hypothetical protein
MSQVFATCIFLAAQMYALPPAMLAGIHHVEGGKPGVEAGPNKNGTYDLGPMQINSSWVPLLAKKWRVSESTARRWVRDDVCTNVGVAAWILRSNLEETGDISKAIAYYNSRTTVHGQPYKEKVIGSMDRFGLINASDGR